MFLAGQKIVQNFKKGYREAFPSKAQLDAQKHRDQQEKDEELREKLRKKFIDQKESEFTQKASEHKKTQEEARQIEEEKLRETQKEIDALSQKIKTNYIAYNDAKRIETSTQSSNFYELSDALDHTLEHAADSDEKKELIDSLKQTLSSEDYSRFYMDFIDSVNDFELSVSYRWTLRSTFELLGMDSDAYISLDKETKVTLKNIVNYTSIFNKLKKELELEDAKRDKELAITKQLNVLAKSGKSKIPTKTEAEAKDQKERNDRVTKRVIGDYQDLSKRLDSNYNKLNAKYELVKKALLKAILNLIKIFQEIFKDGASIDDTFYKFFENGSLDLFYYDLICDSVDEGYDSYINPARRQEQIKKTQDKIRSILVPLFELLNDTTGPWKLAQKETWDSQGSKIDNSITLDKSPKNLGMGINKAKKFFSELPGILRAQITNKFERTKDNSDFHNNLTKYTTQIVEIFLNFATKTKTITSLQKEPDFKTKTNDIFNKVKTALLNFYDRTKKQEENQAQHQLELERLVAEKLALEENLKIPISDLPKPDQDQLEREAHQKIDRFFDLLKSLENETETFQRDLKERLVFENKNFGFKNQSTEFGSELIAKYERFLATKALIISKIDTLSLELFGTELKPDLDKILETKEHANQQNYVDFGKLLFGQVIKSMKNAGVGLGYLYFAKRALKTLAYDSYSLNEVEHKGTNILIKMYKDLASFRKNRAILNKHKKSGTFTSDQNYNQIITDLINKKINDVLSLILPIGLATFALTIGFDNLMIFLNAPGDKMHEQTVQTDFRDAQIKSLINILAKDPLLKESEYKLNSILSIYFQEELEIDPRIAVDSERMNQALNKVLGKETPEIKKDARLTQLLKKLVQLQSFRDIERYKDLIEKDGLKIDDEYVKQKRAEREKKYAEYQKELEERRKKIDKEYKQRDAKINALVDSLLENPQLKKYETDIKYNVIANNFNNEIEIDPRITTDPTKMNQTLDQVFAKQIPEIQKYPDLSLKLKDLVKLQNQSRIENYKYQIENGLQINDDDIKKRRAEAEQKKEEQKKKIDEMAKANASKDQKTTEKIPDKITEKDIPVQTEVAKDTKPAQSQNTKSSQSQQSVTTDPKNSSQTNNPVAPASTIPKIPTSLPDSNTLPVYQNRVTPNTSTARTVTVSGNFAKLTQNTSLFQSLRPVKEFNGKFTAPDSELTPINPKPIIGKSSIIKASETISPGEGNRIKITQPAFQGVTRSVVPAVGAKFESSSNNAQTLESQNGAAISIATNLDPAIQSIETNFSIIQDQKNYPVNLPFNKNELQKILKNEGKLNQSLIDSFLNTLNPDKPFTQDLKKILTQYKNDKSQSNLKKNLVKLIQKNPYDFNDETTDYGDIGKTALAVSKRLEKNEGIICNQANIFLAWILELHGVETALVEVQNLVPDANGDLKGMGITQHLVIVTLEQNTGEIEILDATPGSGPGVELLKDLVAKSAQLDSQEQNQKPNTQPSSDNKPRQPLVVQDPVTKKLTLIDKPLVEGLPKLDQVATITTPNQNNLPLIGGAMILGTFVFGGVKLTILYRKKTKSEPANEIPAQAEPELNETIETHEPDQNPISDIETHLETSLIIPEIQQESGDTLTIESKLDPLNIYKLVAKDLIGSEKLIQRTSIWEVSDENKEKLMQDQINEICEILSSQKKYTDAGISKERIRDNLLKLNDPYKIDERWSSLKGLPSLIDIDDYLISKAAVREKISYVLPPSQKGDKSSDMIEAIPEIGKWHIPDSFISYFSGKAEQYLENDLQKNAQFSLHHIYKKILKEISGFVGHEQATDKDKILALITVMKLFENDKFNFSKKINNKLVPISDLESLTKFNVIDNGDKLPIFQSVNGKQSSLSLLNKIFKENQFYAALNKKL